MLMVITGGDGVADEDDDDDDENADATKPDCQQRSLCCIATSELGN